MCRLIWVFAWRTFNLEYTYLKNYMKKDSRNCFSLFWTILQSPITGYTAQIFRHLYKGDIFDCMFPSMHTKPLLNPSYLTISVTTIVNTNQHTKLNGCVTSPIRYESKSERTYTFWHVYPTKTIISLRIHAVWSVFVVRMNKITTPVIKNAPIEDSDQTVLMCKPIWISARCICPKVCFLTLYGRF